MQRRKQISNLKSFDIKICSRNTRLWVVFFLQSATFAFCKLWQLLDWPFKRWEFWITPSYRERNLAFIDSRDAGFTRLMHQEFGIYHYFYFSGPRDVVDVKYYFINIMIFIVWVHVVLYLKIGKFYNGSMNEVKRLARRGCITASMFTQGQLDDLCM